jgi:hypothetical protein
MDRISRQYSPDEERPLTAYVVLVGLFNTVFAVFLFLLRRSRRDLPARIGVGDLLLLGVGTHKLSRLLTKDWVTSFLRAPFTTYQGSASGPEVNEAPRGHGMQRALGELVT